MTTYANTTTIIQTTTATATTTIPPYDLQTIDYLTQETHSAWLSTAASQIFFMQLGFLCFEIGFVEPEYMETILIKNLEDIFAAFFGYIIFGYTLSGVDSSTNPIIGNFNFTALYNVPKSDYDIIFVNVCFAGTAATIISGAVLERMSNKAYIVWVFLTVAVNYSFIAYWVWNPNGWLNKLGFEDSAGCTAVHMLGGMGSLIPILYLGPRHSSTIKDEEGRFIKLKDVQEPNNPIIMMIGTFILWYGWVAFNTVSPVAGGAGMGADVGSTALLTSASPAASLGTVVVLNMIIPTKFKVDAFNLMTAILSGLVAITCSNHTVSLLSCLIIGFITPLFAFGSGWLIRYKLNIDDPIGVLPVHFVSAIIGLIFEGLLNENKGLFIVGKAEHLGVQCLGIIAVIVLCLITFIIYWELIFKCILYRNKDIHQTPLQLFLRKGVKISNVDPWFSEILQNDTHFSKLMMEKFHVYLTTEIFCSEQLDFLICVSKFTQLYEKYRIISKLPKKHSASGSTIPAGVQKTFSKLHDNNEKYGSTVPNITMFTASKSSGLSDNEEDPLKNIKKMDSRLVELVDTYKKICKQYIKSGAKSQINIPHNIRTFLTDYGKRTIKVMRGEYEDEESITFMDESAISGSGAEYELKDSKEFYIHENIFNDAFLTVYKAILINFRLFLNKMQKNYTNEFESNKKTKVSKNKKVFDINEDNFAVEWVIDEELNVRKSTAVINRAKNKYIVSGSGEVKSAQHILKDFRMY